MIFSNDIAIALADDALIIQRKEDEHPTAYPAYVTLLTGTDRVLACGEEAFNMLGNCPDNITVKRVIREGEIFDFEGAEALLRYAISVSATGFRMIRPRILLTVHDEDDVAKRALKDAATHSGARDVYLIQAGMASAIGMLPASARISESIKACLNDLTRDQLSQLHNKPVHACGNAMQIQGFPQMLSQQLGLGIVPHTSEFHPSMKGTHTVLNELNFLRRMEKKPAKKSGG